jgi:hypothetical protein
MATWTFVKKSGAPTGQINISVGNDSFSINDTTNTSIVTSSLFAAGELSSSPVLTLQGISSPFVPPDVVQDVSYVNGQLVTPGPGGTWSAITSGGGRQTIDAGNLSSSYAVNFNSVPGQVIIVAGTLNANCTITLQNRAAGCTVLLLLTQDATGGRTVTISDGTLTQVISGVDPVSNAMTGVMAVCPNTTDIDVALYSTGSGAQVERRPTAFTLYVDNSTGSDNNAGNSPGQALATIGKAVQLAAIAGHAAEIVLIGVSTGFFNINAPISPAVPIFIRSAVPSGSSLLRNFSTPNSRSFYDATVAAAATQVSSATAAYTSSDINRIVSLYGAGVGGGTFYDFITAVPDATHASFTASTTIARSPATEASGTVKGVIVGDWNRVVTDASITAGQSVITSASASWTVADLNTEVVLARAGQGGQALRAVIRSVSGNTATINGVATNGVSGVRCAIGANFGNMFSFWPTNIGGGGGQSGLRFVELQDTSSGANKIGAAIDLQAVDAGAGGQSNPGDFMFDTLRITNSDAAGGWEHDITADGSWNQSTGGPGIRRVTFMGVKCFGSRVPGETVRLASVTHFNFLGQGIVGTAPTVAAQGYRVLDPQKTAGVQLSSDVVNFVNCEGIGAYFLSEGNRINYIGGDISPAVTTGMTGRRAIELGPTSNRCNVLPSLAGAVSGTNADVYDAGTNNVTPDASTQKPNTQSINSRLFATAFVSKFETYPRRSASSHAPQSIGASGVIVMQSIWMRAGVSLSNMLFMGGSTLNWSTATGTHFIMGLYDPNGNLFAQTADLGGTATYNNSFANSAFAITRDGSGAAVSSVRVPLSGDGWIALLINLGTGGTPTYPTFGGMSNVLFSGNPTYCGTSGTAKTALDNPITVPPTASTFQIYGTVG